MSRLHINMNVH